MPPELGRIELGGQLQQGQRVAARLGDEPFGDRVGERVTDVLLEERAGGVPTEPGQGNLGKARRLERPGRRIPRREHHDRPVRPDPACAEEQGVRRGGVEPVGVVDDTQHQALLGRGSQHREGRDPDQERLHRGSVLVAEGHPQCSGLGGRKVVAQPHHRTQQAMQRSERQRCLGFEPLGAQDGCLASGHHELVEQRGLAHSRLSTHHHAAGRSMPRRLDESGQQRQLLLAADQHASNVQAPQLLAPDRTRRFGRGETSPSWRP